MSFRANLESSRRQHRILTGISGTCAFFLVLAAVIFRPSPLRSLESRSSKLAYDGTYDTRPATWYFPAPSTSSQRTIGYTYGDTIYQSPGYTTYPLTAAPQSNGVLQQASLRASEQSTAPSAAPLGSPPTAASQIASQSLADSDPIMQSVGYILGPGGSVNGALPLAPLPPPLPARPPSVSVRSVRPRPGAAWRARPLLPPPRAGLGAAARRLGWSYGGDGHGPGHWARLRNWGLCGSGQHQSPINLELDVQKEENLDLLRWVAPVESYQATLSPPALTNTFRLNGLKGTMRFRGEDLELSYAVLHTPSEHRWMGRRHAAELQFYHTRARSQDPALAVAVFVEPGPATPPALRPLMAAVHGYLATQITVQQPRTVQVTLPPAQLPTALATVEMNTAMLSADVLGYASNYANYFSYYGSETQPPCREGVTWAVLKTPLALRREDLDALLQAQGPTARPTQEMFGRPVYDIATGLSFQTPA